jgi:hypothetical protein
MKVFVLVWQEFDQSGVYGVTSEREKAEEWAARSNDNIYEEFELNEMPPVEQWCDEKCFPPSSPPDPASPAGILMKVYGEAIVERLNFGLEKELGEVFKEISARGIRFPVQTKGDV